MMYHFVVLVVRAVESDKASELMMLHKIFFSYIKILLVGNDVPIVVQLPNVRTFWIPWLWFFWVVRQRWVAGFQFGGVEFGEK